MLFWSSAAQILAAKMERLRLAEVKLLELVPRFQSLTATTTATTTTPSSSSSTDAVPFEMTLLDTPIPKIVIPVQRHDFDIYQRNDDCYVLHGIHVTSSSASASSAAAVSSKSDTALVLLHGYMNGAAYFYRNLGGLSRYFSNIYALDMLGWGLSSRPPFELLQQDHDEKNNNNNNNKNSQLQVIRTAEDFFVESLEAWRAANRIDKMILAGHSMGGYLSVAYCERYPERVERLILLSPCGVTVETPEKKKQWEARIQTSWKARLMFATAHHVFEHYSAGAILRNLPFGKGESWIQSYVNHRLPAITDPVEQAAVAEYLYANNNLPGSGEDCIKTLLTPLAYAKDPLCFRIPKLAIPSVSFLYGATDWMDFTGGLQTQLLCEQQQQQQQQQKSPHVEVYRVSQAGHLLMLDNYQEVNAGIVLSAGLQLDNTIASTTATSAATAVVPIPTKLFTSELTANERKTVLEPQSNNDHEKDNECTTTTTMPRRQTRAKSPFRPRQRAGPAENQAPPDVQVAAS